MNNGVMGSSAQNVLHMEPEKKKKAPMMNIRFSAENYDYMRKESAIRGLSVTAFTNWIINEYRKDPRNVHENPLFENEALW